MTSNYVRTSSMLETAIISNIYCPSNRSMSANFFITAAIYVVNLMPRSFSYKLRLKNDSIRLLNVVVLNVCPKEIYSGARITGIS